MNKEHAEDHRLITEAVESDRLDRDRLLVHIAREHGFKVQDVANYGMVPLSDMHNAAHSAAEAIPYTPPLRRIANELVERIKSGEDGSRHTAGTILNEPEPGLRLRPTERTRAASAPYPLNKKPSSDAV
ncbi:hypothetical protein [Streptomyces sp. NPDC006638]|uniref:hypothetical protein n=1 Tax=Streptomyces sp. NPDC006638 TaxID=3157183 RepID=UPI0033BEEF9E